MCAYVQSRRIIQGNLAILVAHLAGELYLQTDHPWLASVNAWLHNGTRRVRDMQ